MRAESPGLFHRVFPVTDTNVAAAVRDLALVAQAFVNLDLSELIEHLFLHFTVESYLGGDASSAGVQSLIVAHVTTLQQRTACGGP